MKSTLIHGLHPIETLLNQHPEQIQSLVILDHKLGPRLDKIIELAQKKGVKFTFAPKEKFLKLAPAETTHQGLLAYINAQTDWQEQDLLSLFESTPSPLFLILDGVQDPHNLGACLRTANGAGVTAVISPKDNAASLTATVRKVACGAEQFTPFITVTNLARTLRDLKDQGLWLVGLEGQAEQSLYEVDFTGPKGLILGSEGSGMRRLTKELCDFLVTIPMQGQIDSLNVSNACAVSLYEAVRQRSFGFAKK